MHGANTMALADHDGDRDLDLFWGDFFEPGLLLIANSGTCPAPNFRNPPVQFPVGSPLLTSGYNAPAFGDLSGDGRADLVVGVLGGAYNPLRTSAENLYYLTRGEGSAWQVRSRRLLPVLDIGSESVPAIADLDGDGDLDLVLSNKLDPSDLQTSFVYRLENVGTARRPAFRMRPPLDLGRRFHAAPAFADLDGDGRLDALLGQWGPRLAWYRGTTSGFEPADTALVTITRGSNTVPALGDLDGDGDQDLLVGESSGWLNYYRNTGDTRGPRFDLVSDEFEQIRVGRRSAPALADLDGDGDLDLLVGSESDGVALFRNEGSRTLARLVRDSTFRVEAPILATPAAGDLDGDGDVDLVLGGAGGGVVYLERTVTLSAAKGTISSMAPFAPLRVTAWPYFRGLPPCESRSTSLSLIRSASRSFCPVTRCHASRTASLTLSQVDVPRCSNLSQPVRRSASTSFHVRPMWCRPDSYP